MKPTRNTGTLVKALKRFAIADCIFAMLAVFVNLALLDGLASAADYHGVGYVVAAFGVIVFTFLAGLFIGFCLVVVACGFLFMGALLYTLFGAKRAAQQNGVIDVEPRRDKN